MPLIVHQALKDIRLLRWLLLAWVVVLVAFHAITVYVLTVPSIDAPLLHRLATVENLLSLAGTAAFIVIAVLLVQNDSPATTTTFWVTRPISGRAMLASKLLTAAVILAALPIAGDLLDLLAAGIGARWLPMSRVAFVLAWLLPLMAIAAITVGLSQFALVAIIEILLAALLSAAAFSWGLSRSVDTVDVLAWPLVALALALFGYQYLTRRTRASAVALAVAPVAVVALFSLVSRAMPDLQAAMSNAAQSVAITVDPRSVQITDRGDTSLLDVPLTIAGVSDGTRVVLGVDKAWLQVRTERLALGAMAGASWPRATAEDARREAMRFLKPALAGATLLNADPMVAQKDHLTVVARTSDLRAAGAQAAVLCADVLVAAWTYLPISTAPLHSGAAFRAGALSGKVLDVQAQADRATITLRESEATSLGMPFAFTRYLLRNRRLNQAILMTAVRRAEGTGFLTSVLPLSETLRVAWMPLTASWSGTPVTSPSAWLADAELVAIRVQPGEPITKTIEVRGVMLGR